MFTVTFILISEARSLLQRMSTASPGHDSNNRDRSFEWSAPAVVEVVPY